MRPIYDEYDYLVHLLRCAIHDYAPSELPDGAMFDSVYKNAVTHEVANLAYYSVEKLSAKPENDLLRKWRAKRDAAIIRDINQTFAREEILDRFRDEGIRSLEVQGTKLKALYPRQEMRNMSDIDFIIDPENLGKAEAILTELGYQCENTRGYEVDGFREPNIIVEIHTDFFPEDCDYYKLLPEPFEGTVADAGGSAEPGDEILYLYSVLHIAKHYFREGCGIRRILDLYYLNRRFAETAKADSVCEILDGAGVTGFLADASELAECWFGEKEREPDRRLSEMIAVIKAAGVHGTVAQRLNNKFAREKGEGVRNIKARYVVSRIFPAKWVMHANYPILKKYPVLTPFCVIHRAFKAITKNRKKIASEVKKLRDTEIK